MIPTIDKFELLVETKDVLGKVLSKVYKTYWGQVDTDYQYSTDYGHQEIIGRGIIFSYPEVPFVDGQELRINGEQFYVRRISPQSMHGKPHHVEVLYG